MNRSTNSAQQMLSNNLPVRTRIFDLMRNFSEEAHCAGAGQIIQHSIRAIEMAHYLRQIAISKRRKTLRANYSKFKDRHVTTAVKF